MGDTLNINNKGVQQNTYDAIIIGSGISGGWAAKELCDHGIKTLLLERGKNVVHIKDYPTATKNPWDFPHRGEMPLASAKENPIVSRCYAYNETSQHFFVKDNDILTYRKSLSTGFGVTRLAVSLYCGQEALNAGANLILMDRHVMAMRLNGR